jgi:hypothetical protein
MEPEAAGPRGVRPVVLVWLLLCAATSLPYLKAALAPPPGMAFVGAFYYVDDFYNYLSYVEQAERGAVLFTNKQVLEPHRAALLNLEWLVVGRLSRLLGSHPILVYRFLGLVGALVLLWLLDAWLGRAGLPDSHRAPALLLVAVGGGLGGFLYSAGVLPGERCQDLRAGLFPFLEVLANPHFVAGTTLLALSLRAFATSRPRAAAVWGNLLGLVRPYELMVVATAHLLSVAVGQPPARWIRSLLPLALLLPVIAYNAWLFLANPAFGVFSSVVYQMPPLVDFIPALAPAALLSALALRPPANLPAPSRTARLYLWAWAATGLLVVVARPFGFSLQLLVGVGAPLLCLAALGLSSRAPAFTLAAAAALGSSSAVALRLVSSASAPGYALRERVQLIDLLRPACRPGDLLFAPPDIGLYAGGLTPCRPYAAHRAVHDFDQRADTIGLFYSETSAQWRAETLDRLGIAHVALPAGQGTPPALWLGPDTPFRQLGCVGEPPRALCISSRRSP